MKVRIGNYPKHRWYHNFLYTKFGYTPKQKIKVHIDPWDTWSMDHTLAEIVLPMLYQLAKTKHGSPLVDEEDVPWELQGDHHEDLIHERWDWVMAEMIFAFQHKCNGYDPDYTLSKEDQERMSNGFKLFGKYYEGLWD